jgi:hypothetical protein
MRQRWQRGAFGLLILVVAASCAGRNAWADEGDPKAVVDRAIKALGGEEKLGKAEAFTLKAKGTVTINGADSEFTSEVTAAGLQRMHVEFDTEFNGSPVKGIVVLNGDKGWRKFGDMTMEMDADSLANEKRNHYLQMVATTLVPLKGKEFKLESAGEEKVDDKPAVVLKVTGPDGKDSTLYFDKESGLPVKQVAKVMGFMNDEVNEETKYGEYKDFNGIKRATKIEVKRDGAPFVSEEVTEVKVVDKVAPETFEEPK